MHSFNRLGLLLAAACAAAGCAQMDPGSASARAQADAAAQQARQDMARHGAGPVDPPVRVLNGSHAGLKRVPRADAAKASTEWLKDKRITLDVRQPVPASELVRMLRDKGLNIVTQLPLSAYTYAGYGVTNMEVEPALRLLFGSMGMDYTIDPVGQFISIQPMSSRTWYVVLGNRNTSYTAGTTTTQANTGSSASNTANAPPTTPASTVSTASGGISIQSTDNFWNSLEKELKSRLTILVPRTDGARAQDTLPAPLPPVALPPPVPGASPATAGAPAVTAPAARGDEMFVRQQVGNVTLNPETGAVTVQAPHWLLADIDAYIDKVQALYGAEITFTGELMVVTADEANSRGLDIQAFALFAKNNYGAVFSNLAGGVVSVSFPDQGSNIPQVTTPTGRVAGPTLGILSRRDGLAVFNNYLSSLGTVKVVQRPVISTTSGVPGEFSKSLTRYYNIVSQTAASSGTGGAVMGTQNQLVPVLLGTTLKINPRYDVNEDRVRTQITLEQTVQSGTQNQPQYVTSGATTQQVTTAIPLVTRLYYSGEALLRDGDIVIVGGQTDDSLETRDDGIPGLKDGPLSGLFGTKSSSRKTDTYYFALRVNVRKR